MIKKILGWFKKPNIEKTKTVKDLKNKNEKDGYNYDSETGNKENSQRDSVSQNTIESGRDDLIKRHNTKDETEDNQKTVDAILESVETKRQEKKQKEQEQNLTKYPESENKGDEVVGVSGYDINEYRPTTHDIKQQVKEVLDRRPVADGFITKGNIIINKQKMDYLECEECGYIAHLDKIKGTVKCSSCTNEAQLNVNEQDRL